jgi:riboflavin synthase
MFTGIVDGRARLKKIEKRGRNVRITLQVPKAYGKLKLGSSVAVDGVCLTVVSHVGATQGAVPTLSFDVIPETLKRTHFRGLKEGDVLNLERPLRWKGRMDGHLVQGHVDAAVEVLETKVKSFRLSYPKALGRMIVEKGSVALNGVSLTIGKKTPSSFWVHVIPHTLNKTNLGSWRPGRKVNLEADAWLKARRFR